MQCRQRAHAQCRHGLLDLHEVDATAAEQRDARAVGQLIGIEVRVIGAGPTRVVAEGLALSRAHAHAAHQRVLRAGAEAFADGLRRNRPFPAEQPHLGVAGQGVQAVNQLPQGRLQRHRDDGAAAYLAADHAGAASALAHQQAVVGEHLQRLTHRDPRDAQAPGQLFLAWQLLAIADFAALDQATQETLQLVIQRRVQVAAKDALQGLSGERVHGRSGRVLNDLNDISIYLNGSQR
ncbi:hypothetical protein D3C81_1332170 [compost metagenome]